MFKQFYFKQFSSVYKRVLFQTIQFSIQNSSISNNSVYHKYSFNFKKQFYFKQFSLAQVHSFILFVPKIGPYQVLPFQARVDLRMMAIKEYFAFPKAPALLDLQYRRLVSYPENSFMAVILLCREAVHVFYSPSWLGNKWRIVEFIYFWRILMLFEMQIALLRVWTQVAKSTLYNDNC